MNKKFFTLFLTGSFICVYFSSRLEAEETNNQIYVKEITEITRRSEPHLENNLAMKIRGSFHDDAIKLALGEIPSRAKINYEKTNALFDALLNHKEKDGNLAGSPGDIYEISSSVSVNEEFDPPRTLPGILANAAQFLVLSKEKRIEFLVNKLLSQPE